METNTQNFKCPLCGSLLVRDKWIKITGQWSEYEKERDENKKLLEKYKKEKEEQEKKHKLDLAKAAKLAEASGIEKGIKKEKGERERMSKMLQNQAKAIIASNKKIQELEKQLKEGKTPQTAGFDYEKEVIKILSENFPEDTLKPTGKEGDVIQYVTFNKNEIGSILYECKKTEKFNNSFIKEVIKHQEIARAEFAVIVTHALKEGKSKFFIEENIIVIDPLGLLDVATLLRNSLVEMHKLKLTKEEVKKKGVQILRYMQSKEFRNNMLDTIDKSRKVYELLVVEVKDHQKVWTERIKLYCSIHENIQSVRKSIGEIVTGGSVELERYDFIQIDGSELSKLEGGD
ncbi:MAG: DUF2130 domain-containing protein [Candidatus Kuenenbacteria bacterium]